MRPLSGGDGPPAARPPSRKSSAAEHLPTTFFMTTEEAIQQSEQAARSTTTAPVEPTRRPKDSAFGVQTLADTLAAAFGSDEPADGRSDGVHAYIAPRSRRVARRSSQDSSSSLSSLSSSSPRARRRPTSTQSPSSHPPTPPLHPAFMPSTPASASLQLSDGEPAPEHVASHTLASSRNDADSAILGTSTSLPQLVMPSIQMPSRRPFTTKGKAMGKLKVLVAGRAGTSSYDIRQ